MYVRNVRMTNCEGSLSGQLSAIHGGGYGMGICILWLTTEKRGACGRSA